MLSLSRRTLIHIHSSGRLAKRKKLFRETIRGGWEASPAPVLIFSGTTRAMVGLRVQIHERLLVQQAFSVHRAGKMLVPIIDDAHLMPPDCLRKLRLLCEDFPRSHNLVLIGQPPLLQSLSLSINEEIRSRVTYSALLPRLSPEVVEQFILDQLDRAGLGHNAFTPEALALIVRSGEGLLRRTRNLCLGALIEAVRDLTRIVDLKQVNRVLIQPHWRKDCDQPL